MTRRMALLVACTFFLGTAKAEDDKSLSDLTGRIVLELAHGNVVHCEDKGGLSVWVNADPGYVRSPAGKAPGSATYLRKELVPHADGLVLHVVGPYNQNEIQKVWTTWLNERTRKFEITISVPAGLIGIEGTYGDSFSPEMIKYLLALSSQPVVNQ